MTTFRPGLWRRIAIVAVMAMLGGVALSGAAPAAEGTDAADSLAVHNVEHNELGQEMTSQVASELQTTTDEIIIGDDQRSVVFPSTFFPASATAFMTFSQGTGSFRCTAFMVGANVAMTAAHCLHGGGAGQAFSDNILLAPGWTGDSAPFGVCAATQTYVPTQWTQQGDSRFDYGIIKLDCTAGNQSGFYKLFLAQKDNFLKAKTNIINGYPGDKVDQWTSTDGIRKVTANQVFYRNDTLGGMSGAPLWRWKSSSCPSCVQAIHSGSVLNGQGVRVNVGARVTPVMKTQLNLVKSGQI